LATADGPAELAERRESLTMGFLLLLERLTPIERAVLVLHDALGYGHDAIAGMLERSEAACRQALHRARVHVTVPARREGDVARAAEVTGRFLAAGAGGDVEELLAMLSPEVVALTDGGGIVHAAMRPVRGATSVGRFVANLVARYGPGELFPVELNGRPGVVVHGGGGWAATTIDVDGDGLVSAVYVVANPAKLERLVAQLPGADGLAGPWESAARFRHRRGRPVEPSGPVTPR
jgi:RNA polymerase sigma-70 factor (ECF subfamily)